MKKYLSLLICLLYLTACSTDQQGTVILKTGDDFVLSRNGNDLFIKGVVGFSHLNVLARSGANSVRIWDNYDDNLKRADSMGITALISLPVAAERDGFDYHDESAVKNQKEDILKTVRLLQYHSSILMWAVGNELDYIPGNKPYYTSMWDAVDEIAHDIREIDPVHPVMTVIGTSRFEKVKEIVERCPDIGLLGINAYGDMSRIPGLLKKYGWVKPYIFTEWGVSGYWEVPETEWNAPFEENSSRKAALYRKKYTSVVLQDPGKCLGSYVFLWGRKQETTPTWFGMFDERGNSSEAVNVMRQLWTGKQVINHAPRIDSITLAGRSYYSNVYFTPGETDTAEIYGYDPENDPLLIRWLVRQEADYASYAGQGEATPPAVPGCIDLNNRKKILFRTPSTAGAYRIYVYLYDGKKHFATANFPFYVR